MARWEYMVLRMGSRCGITKEAAELDVLGAHGWELVTAVTDANMSTFFYMKRCVPWWRAIWRMLSGKGVRNG